MFIDGGRAMTVPAAVRRARERLAGKCEGFHGPHCQSVIDRVIVRCSCGAEGQSIVDDLLDAEVERRKGEARGLHEITTNHKRTSARPR